MIQITVSNHCCHAKNKYFCKTCKVGNTFCEHDKQKHTCRTCSPNKFCLHNRRKNQCKDCGCKAICNHNKFRAQCKKCVDPIKQTIKQWIHTSKASDRKTHRFDATNHIDKAFLRGLVAGSPRCYYEECNVPLQYIEYEDNLATIERLFNGVGHTKPNCVIACMKCNKRKVSNYINLSSWNN